MTGMRNTLALTRAEITRLSRNKRYFLFTLAVPVMLYLLFGKQKATAEGVDFKVFYMLSMATMGAFSGALSGNAQRISQEKKEGWIRQLRLTPLPANAYVISKILVSMATTVPSVLIVLVLGRFYGGVHLPAWQWPVLAVTIWFGTTIFAALAIAIGYRYAPDQVQAVSMFLYFGFAVLGGLWYPFSGFLGKVGEGLPTYQVTKICADVVEGVSVPMGLVAGLVIWMVIFIGLATAAVRSTAENL
jgi:ABC-2 type transport system permease protein